MADKHKLTEVDLVSRTAVCKVCGPTTIYVPPTNGRRLRCCMNQKRAQRVRKRDAKRRGVAETHTYVNHCIVEFEAETLTGKCRLCGPVKVKLIGKRSVRTCINSWNAQRDWNNHKLTRGEATALVVAAGKCQNHGCGKWLAGPGVGSDGGQVDHDHTTGLIRGVLCGDCNRALGHANDDPHVLAGLIEYLKNPPGGQVDPCNAAVSGEDERSHTPPF